MNRSFLLIVLLFLFPADQFQAQTGTSKTQPATDTRKTTDAKAVPGSNETNPEARSLYEDGIERLELGQVSEAVERFEKAVKIDPEYAEAYSALGRAYFKLRQWDNAGETFRRAIALKAKKRESQNKLQNLNKPLPALPINAPSVVTTLGSALKPPQVSQAARVNIKFDDQLGSPPVEVRENAAAVQAAGPSASTIPQSTLRPTPEAVHIPVAMNVTPLPPPGESKSVSPASPTPLTEDFALTTIYRVGPQDVLEIRLNSSQPQPTTAFKVTQSGMLEHPQLNGPLSVTGLTVEEIRARIEDDLKNQASIESPKAFVALLEYASHSLVVDGLVKNPGTKSLKSEAIPLAIVVAEAQPLPEAAGVTVVRNGNQILETDLNHTADTRLLVRPGDVVTLHPQINEFVYVGGKVKFPGEKRYRFGLTLMQAIIMAGGATSNSSVAEIVRDGDEVSRTRFDLKAIQAGKAADPLIKARDRISLY